MERDAGRSSEERRQAAEARARERAGRKIEGPSDSMEDRGEGAEPGERGWERPGLDQMSRHYGGPDVYGQRRLVAILVIVGIAIVLFLLLGGC